MKFFSLLSTLSPKKVRAFLIVFVILSGVVGLVVHYHAAVSGLAELNLVGWLFNIVNLVVLYFIFRLHNTENKQEKHLQKLQQKWSMTPKKQFDKNVDDFNLNIINFQGIYLLQENLPFNAPWIFLTGNNGYGKTNILQAIARVLSAEGDELSYNALHPLSEETTITIDFCGFKKTLKKTVDNKTSLPYRIMGYGASRLDMGSDKSTNKHRPCSGLFESQVLLRNIEREGLSRWYFKDDERHKFDQCVDVFKQLMPNLAAVEVTADSEVWYIEKDANGEPLHSVQFADLASGYQNIISMIGDIILHLDAAKSGDNIDGQFRNIVLIDELELYLHPTWQKKLPQLLSDLFPNILFIASTHSPIPLLGAPQGSAFFTVNRSAEQGITMTRLDDKMAIDEMLPNTMLTSPLFGMEDIFANGYSGDKQPRTETTFSDMKLNDAIDKKFDDYMTDAKEQALIERYKRRKSS